MKIMRKLSHFLDNLEEPNEKTTHPKDIMRYRKDFDRIKYSAP